MQMGNEDLGKHYQATGDLPKAFEAFSRMRQDISVSKQIIDVSRHLIEVAVEQRNWIAVTSNVQKIRGIVTTSEEDKSIFPYLQAAEALAHFDGGEYHTAAIGFLNTESGMGSSANTIISPNDVAIYGGLCALATMDRNELQKKVLENSSFRTYLELEPQIRRAIAFFVNSRYTACLNILESYRPDYLLDIYMQKHIDELYFMVRSKSIVQYFIPFSCVTLDSLNQAFAPPGKNIDKELSMMIQRGDLNARINTIDRVRLSNAIYWDEANNTPATRSSPLQPSNQAPARSPRNDRRLRPRSPPPNHAHEYLHVRPRSKRSKAWWTPGGYG
jgi:COP9 signalosome complex subunit 1